MSDEPDEWAKFFDFSLMPVMKGILLALAVLFCVACFSLWGCAGAEAMR